MKKSIYIIALLVAVSFIAGCDVMFRICDRCKEFGLCKKVVIWGNTGYLCRACDEYIDNGGLWIDVLREL